MNRAAKKNQEEVVSAQLELIPKQNHNPYWYSELFNPIYLLNDEPLFNKDIPLEDEVPFQTFLKDFQEFSDKLRREKPEDWSERTTINRFIKPVLEMLGYKSSDGSRVEPWIEDEPFTFQENDGNKIYKPDFILVNDQRELKHIQDKSGQHKINEARKSVILTIEAKYWNRIDEYYKKKQKEDSSRADKKDSKDSAKGLDFEDQCLKYMEMLNKEYGILTDGKIWRLYNLSISTPGNKPYFEFNLGHMIRHINNSDFLKSTVDYNEYENNVKFFYFIFRKKALFSETGEELFVDALLNYSKKYVSRVQEDLKLRFVSAMKVACNGFKRASDQNGKSTDLDTIRNVSESHIFNILFLRYCETKDILPIRRDGGYRLMSISNMLDKINGVDPKKEDDGLNLVLLRRQFADIKYSPGGTQLYDHLLKLTRIVQDGSRDEFKGFQISGFKNSVFSKEEWQFVQSNKLTNSEMVKVLFEIGYAESESKLGHYQQIPYNSFSPRQLGSIYESFLEYKLEKAPEDMALIDKKWSTANLNSNKISALDIPKVKKGELFFAPNNKERKITGSYYTPDCVVQYIVKETIDPLLKGKSSDEILKMKVCDPAMGSAHFLSAVLNYLSKKYLEVLDSEINDDISVSVSAVKKDILHNCIYGADINPRAVKLAKMSLWLESAQASEALEDLDDQIKCTNSLTDENLWKNEWKFLKNGIDAVVGNPPYLGEKGHKEVFQEVAKGWLGKRFYQGKMDLFYFFFHLGFDILKNNGRLGFITTNYFTTALGAKKLRTDFFDRTNVDCLMNLNELRVFGEAKGQHNMISLFSKTDIKTKTKVVISNEDGQCTPELFQSICLGKSKKTQFTELSSESIYDGDEKYIRIGINSGSRSNVEKKSVDSILDKIKKSEFLLGNVFEVNTGIQTGADKVSKKHLEKFKIKAKKDDGIFVVNKNEVNSFLLEKNEQREIIKPFFKNSDISKFESEQKTSEYIIYLDKRLFDFNNINSGLKKHINKFREVIENSVCSPPYLHRPRRNEIFLGPKIVVPQRSKLNTFGYNEIPWYASCDVYFITPTEKGSFDLKYALGVLNSKLYFTWLYMMGKRKGEALELYQKPLSEIPIKDADIRVQSKVIKLVDVLIQGHDEHSWNVLNNFIYEIYGLTKAEISLVDSLYDERVNEKLEIDSDENEAVA